jgi:hypothetical protein
MREAIFFLAVSAMLAVGLAAGGLEGFTIAESAGLATMILGTLGIGFVTRPHSRARAVARLRK